MEPQFIVALYCMNTGITLYCNCYEHIKESKLKGKIEWKGTIENEWTRFYVDDDDVDDDVNTATLPTTTLLSRPRSASNPGRPHFLQLDWWLLRSHCSLKVLWQLLHTYVVGCSVAGWVLSGLKNTSIEYWLRGLVPNAQKRGRRFVFGPNYQVHCSSHEVSKKWF